MKVAIITAIRDLHARAVEWSLARHGVNATLLMYSDYPQSLKISEELSGGFDKLCISHNNASAINTQVDSLWRRRICSPMPREDLHSADYLIAIKESTCVRDSVELAFDSHAKMAANSVAGHNLAKQKPVQLRAAISCSLPIPETLISNDPDGIRRFAQNNKNNGAVVD